MAMLTVPDILEAAVKPEGRVKLGSLLADIGRQIKLTDEEFAVIDQVRDTSPFQAAVVPGINFLE